MPTTTRLPILAIALFASLIAVPAFAQPPDKQTTFTFSAPVTLPGVTLPAGSYQFRIATPDTSDRIVRVFSQDGRTVYATFFTVPTRRAAPAWKPEVRFMETAEGMATAVTAWWHPGSSTGYEFVFPKEQARRLTMGTAQALVTTERESSTVEQTDTPNLVRLNGSGVESARAAS